MRAHSVLRLLAAAALALLAAAAAPAQPIVLKVHHFLPPGSPAQRTLIEPWCDRIARDSGGRLQCRIHPALELGGTAAQLFDQVRDGVVDIAWTIPTASPSRFPRSEVFELPFLTRSGRGASQALWQYVQQHARSEYAGVRPLWLHTGEGMALHLAGSQAPRNLDDLKGMKVGAVTRLNARLLAALGATPVGVPPATVPAALANHTVDGVLVSWDALPAARPDLAASRLATPPGQPQLATAVRAFVMNQARYESLPPDLQRVIDANSGLAMSAWAGQRLDDALASERKASARRGELAILSRSELARWGRAAASLERQWIGEVTAQGSDGAGLLRQALALLRQYDPAGRTSDEPGDPMLLVSIPAR